MVEVVQSVIQNQPFLETLLKMSKGRNSLEFNADYEELPDGYADGITQILEKLKASNKIVIR